VAPTIEDALGELSTSVRSVVVLKDIYDWTHAEIADHLDISVTAAKVRLHRGRKELRAKLRSWREDG
jgi:RNA polymerase sigma-70 factor (ECF subfamily)